MLGESLCTRPLSGLVGKGLVEEHLQVLGDGPPWDVSQQVNGAGIVHLLPPTSLEGVESVLPPT